MTMTGHHKHLLFPPAASVRGRTAELMNRTILFLVLSLLCASPLLAKQEICVKGPMGRDYYLYLPDKIDPAKTYWLVVGVHGYRGNGKGGSGVAGWPDRYDCIAVAPSFPDGFQGLEKQTDIQLLQIFSELQRKYRLYPKLFVTGHSGGSQFAHRFASHHPDQTIACAASSGGTWETGAGYGSFSPAAKTIPIAISCGDKDNSISPNMKGVPWGRYDWAKHFEKNLSDGGYFFKAKYWPGAGHGGYGPGIEQLRNESFSLGTSGLIGQGAKERDEALKKINTLLESGDIVGATSAMKAICDRMRLRTAGQFAADLKANGWQGGDAAAAECARRCAQFWTDQLSELGRRIAARGKDSPASRISQPALRTPLDTLQRATSTPAPFSPAATVK